MWETAKRFSIFPQGLEVLLQAVQIQLPGFGLGGELVGSSLAVRVRIQGRFCGWLLIRVTDIFPFLQLLRQDALLISEAQKSQTKPDRTGQESAEAEGRRSRGEICLILRLWVSEKSNRAKALGALRRSQYSRRAGLVHNPTEKYRTGSKPTAATD